MGRRKKIQELNQIDGRDHLKEIKISVDEVFGYEKSKFPTSSAREYEDSLKEMNKVDLQKAALALGLMPIDDRTVLKERIMNEFHKYRGALACSKNTASQIKISKIGLDILSEGA